MKSILELAHDYQHAVQNGRVQPPTQPVDDRPPARVGRTYELYNDRSRLSDLDQSHPGVQRAIAAVYEWRNRYILSIDPAVDTPFRAPSLVLSGPNGTGKSHIARAVLWSMVVYPTDDLNNPIMDLARPAGRWFNSADLLLALAAHETDWRTVEYDSVGTLIGPAPFVVVDDLGGEGTIPFIGADDQPFERQARWFRFIDFCYDRNIPVIITTNLDIANGAIAAWIGRRAWDRLQEMAPQGQMVGMWDVPSWRVKAGGR